MKPVVTALLASGTVFFLLKALRKGGGQSFSHNYPPLPPFVENRVRQQRYGRLDKNSPLLRPVDSYGTQQFLHVLARDRLNALKDAAAQDGFTNILIGSGWRPHRWSSWAQYEQKMIDRYGSLREGRRWVAYNSPHETGLAMDFASHGLMPTSATNAQQMQTPFYRWLVNNAHRFGITPYKGEAWHWEVKVPISAWLSGEEFTDDYAVMV